MIFKEFEVKDGAFLLRTKYTGDKVYLIQEGKRYWIRNPETLEKLGFSFGQEKEETIQKLHEYEDSGSIDLSAPHRIDLEKGEIADSTQRPILSYRRSAE